MQTPFGAQPSLDGKDVENTMIYRKTKRGCFQKLTQFNHHTKQSPGALIDKLEQGLHSDYSWFVPSVLQLIVMVGHSLHIAARSLWCCHCRHQDSSRCPIQSILTSQFGKHHKYCGHAQCVLEHKPPSAPVSHRIREGTNACRNAHNHCYKLTSMPVLRLL